MKRLLSFILLIMLIICIPNNSFAKSMELNGQYTKAYFGNYRFEDIVSPEYRVNFTATILSDYNFEANNPININNLVNCYMVVYDTETVWCFFPFTNNEEILILSYNISLNSLVADILSTGEMLIKADSFIGDLLKEPGCTYYEMSIDDILNSVS